jgi:DNA polymerase/3'-5' exonuclease PolX
MELARARGIAETIIERLKPHCEKDKAVIVGSIRRGRPFVHDIDLLCIPSNQGQFYNALQQIGQVKGGKKILQMMTQGIMVDIYIATPETWATLLLIRTGSKASNIRLCSLARKRGLRLHADGRGLVSPGDNEITLEHPVICNTEADIFKELGLPYQQPAERE